MNLKQIKADRANGVVYSSREWDALLEHAIGLEAIRNLGWVSVKDRLPEMWNEVMVHPAPTDYCMTASVDREGLWHYGEYDREGQQTYETSGVTHWMPLPATPLSNSAAIGKPDGEAV